MDHVLIGKAVTYLKILEEDQAKWTTYAPAKYHEPFPDFPNGLHPIEKYGAAAVVLLIFISRLSPIETFALFVAFCVWAVVCLALFGGYISVRHSNLATKHDRERSDAIRQAEEQALPYIKQRCQEDGVDLDELRRWSEITEKHHIWTSKLTAAGILTRYT